MHCNIAKQKIDWLQSRGLGDIPFAFCLGTKSKASFASRDTLLFDDRQKVVDEFWLQGGEACLFAHENWRACVEVAIDFTDRISKRIKASKDMYEKSLNYGVENV